MSNTYTQLLIQLVFAVQNRMSLIKADMREELERYITGILRKKGHKLIAIYCMPDHCHVLIGLNPKQSISDLAKDVKSNSSRWINEQRAIEGNFQWQNGYAAFSYSRSQIDAVVHYILNQEEHHKKKTFKEEYAEFLEKFEIEYDEKYLFKDVD